MIECYNKTPINLCKVGVQFCENFEHYYTIVSIVCKPIMCEIYFVKLLLEIWKSCKSKKYTIKKVQFQNFVGTSALAPTLAVQLLPRRISRGRRQVATDEAWVATHEACVATHPWARPMIRGSTDFWDSECSPPQWGGEHGGGEQG